MTSQEWLTNTDMFRFFGRSDALKRVDGALQNFHQQPTPDRVRALKTALAAWVDTKPTGWDVVSKRNFHGSIDTLRGEIHDYLKRAPAPVASVSVRRSPPPLPPVAPVAPVPVRRRPPPPPPVVARAVPIPPPLPIVSASAVPVAQSYVPGKWVVGSFAGSYFKFPLQQKGSSCGPACLRILIEEVKGRDVGEEALRGGIDGSLGGGGVVASNNSHDWVTQGTWAVEKVLGDYKIQVDIHTTNLNRYLLAATRRKPCVAVVAWAAGGLHYVVVVGKNNLRTITVLDPWYGIQQVNLTTVGGIETVSNYIPNENGIDYPSTWHPWVMAVR
ncbi:hypothetical protein NHH82_12725 [Oxalobacteraceae bacterium OTU3REALA1]|nr:hypothetical protein NHH82_12725 [Oxalobacteraceae bacterium OTU3REALA1]